MHPARDFCEADRAELIARAGDRGFAVLAAVTAGRPMVGHAPVLVDAERLRFHLSVANRLTASVVEAGWVLAVITGEDAYVSPDWYAAADQVPTWNYVSVEIEGPARVLSRSETIQLLDDLSARSEAILAPKQPWTRAKMDPARFEGMLGGIVGFEIAIQRIEGTTKLSQNKPADEITRVAAELAKLDDEGAQKIARRMVRRPKAG